MQHLNCLSLAACRIVLAQLTGSGRGGLGSYNSQQHTDLTAYLEEEALRDGDPWLKGLLKRNEMLGALQLTRVQARAGTSDKLSRSDCMCF